MAERIGIDFTKQDCSAPEKTEEKNQNLQKRKDEIRLICRMLSGSTQTFSPMQTYDAISTYIAQYQRWFYSEISTYLFACNDKDIPTFLTNLETLQTYAYSLLEENPEEGTIRQRVVAIDKLYDHSNLAQTQRSNLHDSEEIFSARFNKNMLPAKADFSREMNMQFISLIAIFTALSFIVFGGITSLETIFSGIRHVPVLELIIIGCIWSLCVSNLVFVFMFFISKLTKLSIKSSDREDASVSEKYPFIVWCDFLLLLILAIACWIYYIDYSNSGGWFIKFSQNHQLASSIGGIVIISSIFGILAAVLLQKKHKL